MAFELLEITDEFRRRGSQLDNVAEAGNNNAGKMAMIAMTTNNSINVNPVRVRVAFHSANLPAHISCDRRQLIAAYGFCFPA